MPSSLERIRAGAAALCAESVTALVPVGGGGNSRVYRVETAAAMFALKAYPVPEPGRRDRLQTEFAGFTFVSERLPGSVPHPVAFDDDLRIALYSWVDGARVAAHDVHDIGRLTDFMRALHELRGDPAAAGLAPASEAIFGQADLLGQIDVRLQRLRAVAGDEPELAAFLGERFEPELAARRNLPPELAVLPGDRRTLSPSDFGFHNALRAADGRLTFIDFEYFGWDDPAKLVSDVLFHPAMQLSAAERSAFVGAATAIYGGDPHFTARLRAYLPLIALRWIGIVLNEFIPTVWDRRVYAGQREPWAAVKARQLSKAEGLAERVSALD